MTSNFILRIVNDAGEVGLFQLTGDELWLNALIASISHFTSTAIQTFFKDSVSRAVAYEEVGYALTALMAGKEYQGKLVTLTRSETATEAAPADQALSSGQ